MDPARPEDRDPASPFTPIQNDQPVIETVEVATEGEDCDSCVLALREPLMKLPGVTEVKPDLKGERVVISFDARKVHAPDIHDAILATGYKPAPFAS